MHVPFWAVIVSFTLWRETYSAPLSKYFAFVENKVEFPLICGKMKLPLLMSFMATAVFAKSLACVPQSDSGGGVGQIIPVIRMKINGLKLIHQRGALDSRY